LTKSAKSIIEFFNPSKDQGTECNGKVWMLFIKQINILFAFMPNMGSFAPELSPKDLRDLIIFTPFLMHLPQLLDKSMAISKHFMQVILNMLIFCPASERPDLSSTPLKCLNLIQF
jgi:hypothetical protein